jgi:DNA-directed RNA polymerase subunit RPC12/RpoP
MEGYVCSKCGVTGIKLWRDYQTFPVELVCFKCSGDDREITQDGYVKSIYCGMLTDQIVGSRVPAVRVKGTNDAYWGYTSVPEEDVNEWKALPNMK